MDTVMIGRVVLVLERWVSAEGRDFDVVSGTCIGGSGCVERVGEGIVACVGDCGGDAGACIDA